MNRNTITEIICSLLILLFTYAAISKLVDHAIFQLQLSKFPVLNSYAVLFSWFIPVGELVTVLLLLIPEFKLYGLYASAVLLCSFTIFLIFMLSFGKSIPCSCGGIIALLTWKQHIVFNMFFLSLAVTGAYLKQRISNNTPDLKTLQSSA